MLLACSSQHTLTYLLADSKYLAHCFILLPGKQNHVLQIVIRGDLKISEKSVCLVFFTDLLKYYVFPFQLISKVVFL